MSENKENQSKDQLKEVFASLEAKAKELKDTVSKADCDMVTPDNFKYLCSTCDNLYNMIYNLRDAIYQGDGRIWDALYAHKQNGHIPPIVGAEKMQNALEILGIDGDYEIQKPTVWVQASKTGNKIFNVDLGKIKK